MKDYDSSKGLIAGGAVLVYFNKDFKDLIKEDERSFYGKLIYTNKGHGGIDNEYFGDDGVRQDSYNARKEFAASRTPRKLKEFEYYGNNGGEYQTSALDSYKGYDADYNKLSTAQQNELNNNSGKMQIAKVDFVDPDTQKLLRLTIPRFLC